MNKNLRKVTHEADLCIVGGGMSGLCAAVSAARHGMKVVLMQDRPVLGGNASSEIRMWISGAHGKNNRETGILEEIMMENYYRNPNRTYPVWDSVLFDLAKREKNITLIMNCSCNDAEMEGNSIKKIIGWQTTTQMWHIVEARYFADCSGDSILAPLTNAEYRVGREARSEFNESIGPEVADDKTMGLTCQIQAVETNSKTTFIPPEQSRKFTPATLYPRYPNIKSIYENYWYLELGGEADSIHDTEELRDELVRVAYGMWDFIKNDHEIEADNWELSFMGFLPGKRESRRYVGDYIMTQNDVEAEGRFDDIIAYGGWTMDDHNPKGIDGNERPTIHWPAPSPYGIPYRCIYSKNISNLFFAGRNISVTHAALSSTRVMATCSILGQALGTAASIAKKYDTSPRGVYENHINELKQTLMEDDCYIPFNKMEMSEISRKATYKSSGENVEMLINGYQRPIGDCDNMWKGKCGDYIEINFDKTTDVKEINFTFDSDLNRETVCEDKDLCDKVTMCNRSLSLKPICIPKTLVKSLKIEAMIDGEYKELDGIKDNYQRAVRVPVNEKADGLRITLLDTNGNETVGIHSVNIF
ncbi:MAG: FAD-dependent oxidoreductase [Clostridia bacterium]|nr:FAD-dependent oxidoreductase [Clostridia bacterium]